MPWMKVDDRLHGHPKSAIAGTHAMGLWVLAGSWCMAFLTDGFVPVHAARRMDPDAPELASMLVAAGLWETAEGGWQFVNWGEFQPTRESVERDREAARTRMATVRANKGRSSKGVQANKAGTSPYPVPVPPTSKEVDPTADAFAEFWDIYPRKQSKQPAAKAYAKAVKGATAEVIMQGLLNSIAVWRAAGTEAKFIPHAATWLNGGRWADEVPLPDMPNAPTERVTLAQCEDPLPHGKHLWTDLGNKCHCQGVTE